MIRKASPHHPGYGLEGSLLLPPPPPHTQDGHRAAPRPPALGSPSADLLFQLCTCPWVVTRAASGQGRQNRPRCADRTENQAAVKEKSGKTVQDTMGSVRKVSPDPSAVSSAPCALVTIPVLKRRPGPSGDPLQSSVLQAGKSLQSQCLSARGQWWPPETPGRSSDL